MKFYFTYNSLPGSRAIRRALGEDCSHFALAHNGLVIESRMENGVRECSEFDFLSRNRVRHSLELKAVDHDFAGKLVASVKEHARGADYDPGAILFWAAAVLAKAWFNKPLPTHNKWGTAGRHTCVEILRGSEHMLGDYLGVALAGRDLEMTTPHGLYALLTKSPKIRVARA
jgi:hypothetical protein